MQSPSTLVARDKWTALNLRFWNNARAEEPKVAARELAMSAGLLRKVSAFEERTLALFSMTELPHFRPSNPAECVASLNRPRGNRAYTVERRIIDPVTCAIYWMMAREESISSPMNAVTFWGLHSGLAERLSVSDLDDVAILAYGDTGWTLGDETATSTLADEVVADPREGQRLRNAHMGLKLALGARGRFHGA